jgi:hypothetical protein
MPFAHPEELEYVGDHDGDPAECAPYHPCHWLTQAPGIWAVPTRILRRKPTFKDCNIKLFPITVVKNDPFMTVQFQCGMNWPFMDGRYRS